MLLTIAATVVVLGVLIFVHELGHFLAAKAVGVGVPRFSIGFGPPTPLRFRRGETEYVVAWFPLGGYVKMASREEQEAQGALEGGATEPEYPPEKLFEHKPLPARVLVISAGVLMNALFAWAAYSAITGFVGRSVDPTTTLARVDTARLPPPARALADVRPGAQIVAINGDSVESWQDIQQAVIDPAADDLRFRFAGRPDAVVVPIPGTDPRARAAVAQALKPNWPAEIGYVEPGQPAARANIGVGDRIVAIGDDSIRSWDDLQQAVEGRAGDTLAFAVLRGDSVFEVSLVPAERTVRDVLSGEPQTVGRVGIGPALDVTAVRFGPVEAVTEGARRTWEDVETVFFTLKGMFVGHVSVRELGGPILIGQVSGQFARAGPVALLVFMAFLSVNLAILNLLPIPVLDGGHLVFLLVEGIRGKPLSLDFRLRLTQIGMLVLLGILILVFTNDIVRLIGG